MGGGIRGAHNSWCEGMVMRLAMATGQDETEVEGVGLRGGVGGAGGKRSWGERHGCVWWSQEGMY